MNDLWLTFGGDLSIGPSGDLMLAGGTEAGRQRVLRRLLTNPGDDMWAPDYGAGLPGFVGQPASGARIRAVVRGQIFKERAVARSPEPKVQIAVDPGGTVDLIIGYADADGAGTQSVSATIGSSFGGG